MSKEFEPVEYTLCGNARDNYEFLSRLEERLTFVQDALRKAGHPSVDVENIHWEIKSDGVTTATLRFPKKTKAQHIGVKFEPPESD